MIIIDGIIFSLQTQGGITVYFKALIEYLSRCREKTKLILDESLYERICIDAESTSIDHQEKRLLERYRKCRVPVQGKVFHSSYYRQPDKSETPTIVTVHDFIYERYQRGPRQWVHTAQKSAAIRAAQAVICISESTKDDLLEFIGETPGQTIHVIHNGVSDVFRNLRLEPSTITYMLFVGQRAGYKNFRLVLEAMMFLPELELHCVGGGSLQPRELVGLPDSVVKRVFHMGFVTDENLNVLYNGALCLVYPSSYEGFGIPVLEAMRAGCPVVSVDCKAVLEVGRGALVVAEPDPRAIAESILKTASSKRPSLIKQGLTVAQGYSWDATHKRTLEVYRSLGA